MRCSDFHLLTGLATFLVGLAVVSILDSGRHALPPAEVLRAEPTAPTTGGPPALLSSPPPSAGVIFDYDPKEFNPRGDYFILGSKPKNLREFDCLELAVDGDRASGGVMVQTYAKHTYAAHYVSSGLVTGRRITFVTAPSGGRINSFDWLDDHTLVFDRLEQQSDTAFRLVPRSSLRRISLSNNASRAR